MSVAISKDKIEKLTDSAVETVMKECIKEAFKHIFDLNGVPVPLGSVVPKVYTEYGKTMLRVLETMERYEPQWAQLKELRNHMVRVVSETDHIVRTIDPRRYQPMGVGALFAALVDPRVKARIQEWYQIFNRYGTEVVGRCDALLAGYVYLLELLGEHIHRADDFLGVDRPRNNFDRVLGTGILVKVRDDVCLEGAHLLNACERLVAVRNEWADRLGIGSIPRIRLADLEDRCQMMR